MISDSAITLALATSSDAVDYLAEAAKVYHQDSVGSLQAIDGAINIFVFSETDQLVEISGFNAVAGDQLDFTSLMMNHRVILDSASVQEDLLLVHHSVQPDSRLEIAALINEQGENIGRDQAITVFQNASGHAEVWLWLDGSANGKQDQWVQEEELYPLVNLVGVEATSLTEANFALA